MWLDIKEQQPTFSRLYLVWYKGDYEFAYWFSQEKKFKVYINSDYQDVDDNEITHWQRLEEPE